MCGRNSPRRCRKLCCRQTSQSALGRADETEDHSLVQRSQERSVCRSRSHAPVRNLIASVTAIEAARLTAEFRMPAVSQVSTVPVGGSGKIQARQAVSSGRIFIVTAYEPTAAE